MNAVYHIDCPYLNRREAGLALAAALRGESLGKDPVVLALPRGGVPVAAEVAEAFSLPLEIFLVRKLGVPGQPEVAMGALASGGVQLLDEALIADAGLDPESVAAVIQHENDEIRRREQTFRPRRTVSIGWRPAIVVDDGLDDGFTVRAAIAALRRYGCPHITVAAPVGSEAICAEVEREVDLLVCPLRPQAFESVSRWYEDFHRPSDDEVVAALQRITLMRDGTL